MRTSPSSYTKDTPFTCTQSHTGEVHNAVCHGCRDLGPADVAPQLAIERAEQVGWKQYAGHLFCVVCRGSAARIVREREMDRGLFAGVLQ